MSDRSKSTRFCAWAFSAASLLPVTSLLALTPARAERVEPSIGWSNPHHAYLTWRDPQSLAYEVNEISLATGESRILGGSKAAFCQPTGLAIGPQGNLYVSGTFGTPCHAAIEIFARGASGNVSPIAHIRGRAADIHKPLGIGFDPEGRLYLAQGIGGPSGSGEIKVFPAGAKGDVAPIAIIAGSNTQFSSNMEPAYVAIDATDEIFVGQGLASGDEILKFPAQANGNVSPIATAVVGSGDFNEMQVSGSIVSVSDGDFHFDNPTVYELSIADLTQTGSITSRNFEVLTADADTAGTVYVQDFKKRCGSGALCGRLFVFEPGHKNPSRVIQEGATGGFIEGGGYIVVGP